MVSHLQAIGFYRKRRKSAFYRLLQEIESAYELAKIIVDVYISRIFGVYSDREVCKKLGAVKKGRVYRNCPSFVIGYMANMVNSKKMIIRLYFNY